MNASPRRPRSTSRSSRSAARSRSRSATAPCATSSAMPILDEDGEPITRLRFKLDASGHDQGHQDRQHRLGRRGVVRAREGRLARGPRVLGRRRVPDELRLPRAVRHLPAGQRAAADQHDRPRSRPRRSRSRASPAASIFAAPRARGYAPAARVAADRHVQPGRLPAAWATLRPQLLPGRHRRDGSRTATPSSDHARHRPDVQARALGGVRDLQNATIEGIVAGKKWRIKNGDGRQFFIEKPTTAQRHRGPARPRRAAHLRPRAAVVRGRGRRRPDDQVGPARRATSSSTWTAASRSRSRRPLRVLRHRRRARSRRSASTGRVTGLLIIALGHPTLASRATRHRGRPGHRRPAPARDHGRHRARRRRRRPRRGRSSRASSTFKGRVQVMLNTTLQEQTFDVPEEFLGVLPDDFPTADHDLQVGSRRSTAWREEDPDADAADLRRRADRGLDHALRRHHAQRLPRASAAGRERRRRRADRRRREHEHPVPRLAVGLDRPPLRRPRLRLGHGLAGRASPAASRSRSTPAGRSRASSITGDGAARGQHVRQLDRTLSDDVPRATATCRSTDLRRPAGSARARRRARRSSPTRLHDRLLSSATSRSPPACTS